MRTCDHHDDCDCLRLFHDDHAYLSEFRCVALLNSVTVYILEVKRLLIIVFDFRSWREVQLYKQTLSLN